MRATPAIRLLGSAGLAVIVVSAMLLAGLKLFGFFDRQMDRRSYQRIDLLTDVQRRAIAEWLGEDTRRVPRRPEITDIPAFELPGRILSGFVQLEVTVAPDGTVSDVEVIDAAPAGVFEREAEALVRQRTYPPHPSGLQIPMRHSEIVEFSVPATRPANTDEN